MERSIHEGFVLIIIIKIKSTLWLHVVSAVWFWRYKGIEIDCEGWLLVCWERYWSHTDILYWRRTNCKSGSEKELKQHGGTLYYLVRLSYLQQWTEYCSPRRIFPLKEGMWCPYRPILQSGTLKSGERGNNSVPWVWYQPYLVHYHISRDCDEDRVCGTFHTIPLYKASNRTSHFLKACWWAQ